MQWKLSIDEIIETAAGPEVLWHRLKPLVEAECACLLDSLNQDVVGTVYEYLCFIFERQKKNFLE